MLIIFQFEGKIMYTFISKCEQDTIEFAAKISSQLKPQDIVILSGELR